MASKFTNISEDKYHNWVKAGLALLITKKGIQPFVENEIETFQKKCLSDIRRDNRLATDATCTECYREGLVPTKWFEAPKICPNGICNDFKDKIISAHRYVDPSFKNTDVSRWCFSYWEVAKCFMPPDGYANVKSAEETDFNGIINVIINHKSFKGRIYSRYNFSKVRDIGRKIRHSPSLEIGDMDLQEYFNEMKSILTDKNYLASADFARTAVEKLSQLQNSTLVVETDDVRKVLDDKHENETDEQNKLLLKDTKHALIMKMPNSTMSVENVKEAISTAMSYSYREKLQALQEDLIEFYDTDHCTIPISPLVQENDVPVVDFYVQQRMEQFELNVKRKHRTSIPSYEAMFMNGQSLCRSVFVIAPAGVGKTTFVKRLCYVWCYSKDASRKEPMNVSASEKDVLNKFEFLFLVLLRDVFEKECETDEMIKNHVIKHLSRKLRYDDKFLADVLHQQICLVVLDGLDEWSHPLSSNCENREPIPHRQARRNCTILYTTRPWKMFEAKISNSRIDKCIELKDFDKLSSSNLINNVLRALTDDNASQAKETEDFLVQIEEKSLTALTPTPVILIQLICLWHENKSLGESKCQIYSNIVDFVLERAVEKHGQGKITLSAEILDERHIEAPICLGKNEYCRQYHSFLLDVGQLAYKALCSERKESALVFESSLVKETLTDNQLHDCLQFGILTENRVTSCVASRRLNYSFMHKSFQEYFCAYYIAFTNDKSCINDILKMCHSVAKILELSDVFVFLSGLSPKSLTDISSSLPEIISRDQIAEFRRKVCTSIEWNAYYKMLKEVQDLYIHCMEESKAENTGSVNFILEDLVIDEDSRKGSYSSNMKELIEVNRENIKSLHMYDIGIEGWINRHVEIFQLNKLKGLNKLEITGDLKEDALSTLLQESAKTMKCLSICRDLRKESLSTYKYNPFTDASFVGIQKMTQLEALMLECFSLPHYMLQGLFTLIEQRSNMTEVCLAYIKCSDHDESCCGFLLDLSKHSSLSMLELGHLPVETVNFDTESLEKCRIGSFQGLNVLPSVLNCLENAPKLEVLMCFEFRHPEEVNTIMCSLSHLTNLCVIVFKRMDLADHVLNTPLNVKHLKLTNVKMSSLAFEKTVRNVECYQRVVKFELSDCEMTPEEKYADVKRYIKDSENFVILYDVKEEDAEQLLFRTVVHEKL